ncbi:hypothetical protein NPX13_g7568 [Xylaria arbuscula]|uniref:Uncharacterized protein n=1 Tax=Xylaria arbuscula TaxID=114810 RepID=A0A9W8N9S0_9PEZI|nr:hypothetical protein NPX13_g7568 [Xylaria arbuscula]
MATTSGRPNSSAGNTSSAGGVTPPASTGTIELEDEITFVGSWDTVQAAVRQYPRTTETTAIITASNFSPRVSAGHARFRCRGCLSEVLEYSRRWPSFLCLIIELTLWPSNASGDTPERPRSIVGGNSSESSNSQHHHGRASIRPEQAVQIVCGNCHQRNHTADLCVKVGDSGWMEACPKCNSRLHIYDRCPRRRQDEDFKYLILNRGNKPPVKSSLNLGLVVLQQLGLPNSLYLRANVIPLPHSSEFSRLIRDIPVVSKHPMTLPNGLIIEPARHNQSLGDAVSLLGSQTWRTSEDLRTESRDAGTECAHTAQMNSSTTPWFIWILVLTEFWRRRACQSTGANGRRAFGVGQARGGRDPVRLGSLHTMLGAVMANEDVPQPLECRQCEEERVSGNLEDEGRLITDGW